MSTNILITGATGYIGGAILDRLLVHPERSSFSIFAIVRSAEKAKKFESDFDVHPIVGSLDDHKLVEDAVAKSDIVIHAADADNYGAIKAILAGHKRYHNQTGKVPILIHTSGTGVLTDDAQGLHTTDTIYSDLNAEQIESIPDTAVHRNVDLEIVAADKAGYVRTHIVLPSTIYGIAEGPIFDAGLANPHSVQVPQLIKASIQRGRAGQIGEGKNLWPNVWINDVADLFLILFDTVRKNPEKAGHGREGFYFGENGEHELHQISEAIGDALVKAGKASDPTVTTFTDEEAQKYFGGKYLGSNSRARAERSRALGWKPTRTTEDLIKSIQPEVNAIIAKGQYQFPQHN